MKLCIFGAGAIGGLMAAKLAQQGDVEVTVIARGPHLAAMQQHGLKLISDGQTSITHPRCVASAEEAGPQDYVVVTLKAHSLPSAAKQMQPLIGPETAIVSAVNGIPWWYFHSLAGPHLGRRVESVDPGGVVSALLPPERAIGCIVYPAAEVPEPGVIEHTYGDRFTLGEPDGSRSPRAEALSKALMAAGFKAPVRPRIRDELWVKLWGNLAFNPLSALTGATPVFVDVDQASFNMDAKSLKRGVATAIRLGLKPRAVIPVDLFGQSADHDAIGAIAEAEGMFVLDDAAQAFGASYKGRRLGSFGLATATSFFPAKPLGC